ncbi:MAG: DUF4062 domain-containing protein [Leptothrix sp. (in: b-proteobacteria)]
MYKKRAGVAMANRVYLSSTLDDLRPYREAALDALRKAGYLVTDSYEASPEPTVDKCLDDVRQADLYVGLFAGRYGWCPSGHDRKSITELEYRAAVAAGKKCFIFLRPLKDIPGVELEGVVEGDPEAFQRLKDLRNELQSGKNHTCNLFASPADLALKLTQALPPVVLSGGMFREPPPHPCQLSQGLLLVGVKGSDEAALQRIAKNLPPSWQPALATFAAVAAQMAADRLAIDKSLARSRCVALYLSRAGLTRLREAPALALELMRLLDTRLGRCSVLLDQVERADWPADWPVPEAFFPVGAWLAAGADSIGGELANLVQALPGTTAAGPDVVNPRLVSLAYSVLAMTRAEAEAIQGDPEQVRDALGRPSFELFSRVAAKLGDEGAWVARYGLRRCDWQPFGSGTAADLLQEVVASINSQVVVPKRDQDALLGNQIRLRHYPFEPASFKQGSADWPLLEAMRARGCLVLVDELSILHPELHGKANVFLSDTTVTVATLSGVDPALLCLDQLIDSPLKIDMLVDRFFAKLDPRCELAVNSLARMRRWLRTSVPEALAGSEAQGADPERRALFRAQIFGGTAT